MGIQVLPSIISHFTYRPVPPHDGIIVTKKVLKYYTPAKCREVLEECNYLALQWVDNIGMILLDRVVRDSIWIITWIDSFDNHQVWAIITGSEL